MLHSLLFENRSDVFDCVIRRYVNNPEGKKYEELISEIYSYMGKSYRTEYFYKNTMLNKLLFKQHNYKKTIALTELPIGKSKADFVMINGKGVVYEIKTELDNLERLNSQIKDYYKAFTEVVIVTYGENIDKVVNVVPQSVGIIQLTKRKALKIIREPKDDSSYLDYYTIFKLLRKKEFEDIIIDQKLCLPEVVQFRYYKECYQIMQKIDITILQKAMLTELKTRMKIQKVELCLKTPTTLRFLTYFDDMVANYQSDLAFILNKNYGG